MTNRLHSTSGVAITRATHVEVNAPNNSDARRVLYIQTDGESVGVLPATISTIPDALTLLLPKELRWWCRRFRLHEMKNRFRSF